MPVLTNVATGPAIEWVRRYEGTDGFIRSLQRGLLRYGSLTQLQHAAAVRNMQREQAEGTEDDHARVDNCTNIFNGKYTVDAAGEHMVFEIATVRRGGLEGKRIVKYVRGESKTGFAFLGRDGSLRVWRRYAGDRRWERIIEWGKVALEYAPAFSAVPQIGGAPRIRIESNGWTIQLARKCRRCNRELTVPTSIEAGIGPECMSREAERTRAARLDATIVADVEPFQRAMADAQAAARAVVRGPVFLAQRTSRALAAQAAHMSEVLTGEVQ